MKTLTTKDLIEYLKHVDYYGTAHVMINGCPVTHVEVRYEVPTEFIDEDGIYHITRKKVSRAELKTTNWDEFVWDNRGEVEGKIIIDDDYNGERDDLREEVEESIVWAKDGFDKK